jgi:hypothetical protein
MAVTTVSIRLAIKKIATITCGMSARVIPVAVIPVGRPTDRLFAVAIPFEYRSEVYSYLAEHLPSHPVMERGNLVLTSEQAAAVVQLAEVTVSTQECLPS